MTRTLKKTLVALVLMLCVNTASAVHISGANISAECIGGNQYRITLNWFQDCLDGVGPTSTSVRIVPSGCSETFSAVTVNLVEDVEVSQLCTDLIPFSTCNGGTQTGKRRLTYEGLVTINPSCSEYRIMWKQNNRSNVTLNLDNSGSDIPFYVHTYIYPQADPCNDSPIVTVQETPYVCVGDQVTYDFGVVDPEGDSLVFSYTEALTSPGGITFAPATYAGGFTGAEPIPGALIDPVTGTLSFTPTLQGQYTFAFLIEQFDDQGNLLGSVTMDIIIVAVICPSPPPEPVQDALVNFIGTATQTGPLSVDMCYGDQFCADFEFQSSNALADITVNSNIESILPGATITQTGGNPATITLCWEANQFSIEGPIILIADDDLCPVPGLALAQFEVNVIPGVYAGPDVSICEGESVQLQAVGDTDFTWEVFTGEPINLGVNFSCDDCPNPIASPSIPTEYIVTGADQGSICFYKDTLRIDIALDNITSTSPSTCGLDNGSIQIDVQTGNGDYAVIYGTDTIPFTGDSYDSTGFAGGTYNIGLLDILADCVVDLTLIVDNEAGPEPEAGADQTLCGEMGMLSATTGPGDLSWTFNGPGNASFGNSNSANTSVSIDTPGEYTFYITELDTGTGCDGIDSLTIWFSGLVTADAGPDDAICSLSYTMQAVDNGIPGTWVVVPPGPSFSDITDPNATVTAISTGSYTFFWSVDAGNGCTAASDVIIEFLPDPVADAGDDFIICTLSDTLQASASGGSGTWTTPAGISVNNPIDPMAVATASGPDVYTLTWTVDNGTCTSDDQVTVTVEDNPESFAGFDQLLCGTTTTLEGNGLSGNWSGPVEITFDDASDPTTSISASSEGTYFLNWTLGSGDCASTDEVIIVFVEQPNSEAGSDEQICGTSSALSAIPSAGLGTWSGPPGVVFTDVNDPNSSVSVPSFGSYTLTWSEDNGNGCTDSDDVTLEFFETPVSDVGDDEVVCGNQIFLNALASIGSGTWTSVPPLTIVDPSSANTSITAPTFGLYTLTWTEENGPCSDFDSVVIEFVEPNSPDAGTDFSICGLSASLGASNTNAGGSWVPAAGAAIADPSDPNSSVTVVAAGSYEFIWSETGDCTTNDTVTVSFIEQPAADAGADIEICGSEGSLSAIPSVGFGAWSPEPGIIFDDLNDPSSGITATASGSYTLTWTEDNGNGCVSSATVDVAFISIPNVEAGTSSSVCGLSQSLGGSIDFGIASWSGPSELSFSDDSNPTASVTSSSYGAFTLFLLGDEQGCTALDSVLVEFIQSPTVDAGTGFSVCGDTVTLAGIVDVGSVNWTGPPGIGFDSASSPSTLVSSTAPGTFSLTLTSDNAGCTAFDEIEISFLEAPVSSAGSDTDICGTEFTLEAIPSIGTGLWTGPAGIIIDAPDQPNSLVTAISDGNYELIWTEDNGVCSDQDTVVLTFAPPPTAQAGSDFTVCGLSGTLDAIPSVGNGIWTGPTGIGFSDSSDPSSLVTADDYGSVEVVWTETLSICSDDDTLTIEFLEPPVADAGDDASICGDSYVLQGFADGGTGTWTIPSGVSIDDVNDPNANLNSSAAGSYELVWTVEDGLCSSQDSIALTFIEQPIANAGDDASICGLERALEANTPVGVSAWTGPVGISFSDPADPNATATAVTPGLYTLTWTAVNQNTCSSSDQVDIEFLETPQPEAGLPEAACGTELILEATPDQGSGSWSGPAPISFGDVSNPASQVSSSVFGEFLLFWTESNGTCSGSDSVLVRFDELPTAVTAGLDISTCGINSSLSASADFGDFQWEFPVGISGDDSDPLTEIVASSAGSYIIPLSVSNGLCEVRDTVIAEFLDTPLPSAGTDEEICGLDAVLSAIPDISGGSWSLPAGLTALNLSDPNSSITASNAGTYTLTWSEDNGACIGSDEVELTFYDSPLAQAGDDMSICGIESGLTAIPSIGAGVWSGPSGISFADVNDPLTNVQSSGFGTFVLNWTETNGVCESSDDITLEFLGSPVADAGSDLSQCGLQAEIASIPSIGVGNWTVPSEVQILSGQGTSTIQVSAIDFGSYEIYWDESNGQCTDQDTLVLELLSTPDTAQTVFQCIDGNTSFILSFDIVLGDPDSYSVIGDPGTLTGNEFSSDPITNGGAYSFSLSDANNCGSIDISGTYSCSSLSFAGTLDGDTLHGCIGDEVQAIYNSDAFLDPNDLQEFILHDQSLGIGSVLDRNDSPSFQLLPGMTTGTVYFISSVVGNNDGGGNVDLEEVGTSISQSTPVIWHDLPTAFLPANLIESCAGLSFDWDIITNGQAPFSLEILSDGAPQILSGLGEDVQTISSDASSQIVLQQISDVFCSSVLADTLNIISNPIPIVTGPSEWINCENEPEDIPLGFLGSAPFILEVYLDGEIQETLDVQSAELGFMTSMSGEYEFLLVEDSNCPSESVAELQVTILPAPPPSAGPDQIACSGELLTLGESQVPDVTYSWLDTEFIQDNQIAQPTISEETGAEPSILTLTLITTLGQCSTEDLVQITYNPLPQGAEILGDDSICFGDETILTAIGGDEFTWIQGEAISNASAQSPSISPSSSQTYSVEIINSFGCSVEENLFVVVSPLPQTAILSDVINGCPPLDVEVLNLTPTEQIEGCQWVYPDGTLVSESCDLLSLTFNAGGTYEIFLDVISPEGCSLTTSESIQVDDAQAEFIVTPSNPTVQEEVFFIDISESQHSASWTFDGSPIFPEENGSFLLSDIRPGFYELCLGIITEAGCADTLCKDIEVNDNVRIWVPNAFTPDEADALNPRFGPVIDGQEWISNYFFQVLDRRGHIVYETLDPNDSWDGTGGNLKPTPIGVYTWRLGLQVFGEAFPRELKGKVTLIR